MVIAVTGATGYVGSHMLLDLVDRGDDVVAISRDGELPPSLASQVPHHRMTIGRPDKLHEILKDTGVTSIIHFPDDQTVPTSIINPLDQYNVTLGSTLTMLTAAKSAGVERLVFSSTATVYGIPERMPIREETPKDPISPLGAAMAMAERIVQDVCTPACISTAILRYFNVAGADPKGRAGELGKPRHLIKAAAQIVTGRRKEPLKIYGEDYDTPDGTAIRDYVHVSDIADAHSAAHDFLVQRGNSVVVNVGYGEGVSVREVITAIERVSGRPMDTLSAPRRAGDPPQLIADTATIKTLFRWTPRYNDIETIVRTAIEWEAKSSRAAA